MKPIWTRIFLVGIFKLLILFFHSRIRLPGKASREPYFNRFLMLKIMTEPISRVLFACSARQSSIFTRHCWRVQALRLCRHENSGEQPADCSDLKVLHRIGFTADLCYHRNGWALTSPFHPYHDCYRGSRTNSSREGRILSVASSSWRIRIRPATWGAYSAYSITIVAVYFCCTFPRVAPGGRYPLSCSLMHGLSSR